MHNFPDRLRSIMSSFDLNQARLAELLGMKQAAVSRWLSGDADMPQSTAMAIQAALGVRWQWLLNGTGSIYLEQVTKSLPFEIHRIADIFSQISSSDRAKILAYAEGFMIGKQSRKING